LSIVLVVFAGSGVTGFFPQPTNATEAVSESVSKVAINLFVFTKKPPFNMFKFLIRLYKILLLNLDNKYIFIINIIYIKLN
jgi:hypothetical protein